MRYLSFIFLFFGFIGFSQAQIQVFPLQKTAKSLPTQAQFFSDEDTTIAVEDTVMLSLPFFEDFLPHSHLPDTNHWQRGGGVLLNNNMGIRIPSQGIATFDGVDELGVPYEEVNVRLEGYADRLTSHFFDLSEYGEFDSLLISFFWQSAGLGEMPDANDRLILEFQNEEGEWVEAWRQAGGNKDTVFTQTAVHVDDRQFLHEFFRFRFSSYQRLSGPYDVWNLDYIYFDASRDPEKLTRLDLATTQIFDNFIAPYTAMPLSHYIADTLNFTRDTLWAGLNNLDSRFNVIAYDCVVEDMISNTFLGSIKDSADVVEEYPELYKMIGLPYAALLPLNRDSLELRTTFRVNTDESDSLTLRNDTIRRTTVLKNYYAYDDGSAEYAAGINQKFGQLAYQYYTPIVAEMSDIDINFVQVGENLEGQTFNLRVWQKLDTARAFINDSLLLVQNVTFRYPKTPNGFIRIPLARRLAVSDTFYIGIEQLNKEVITIGLDRNTDTGDKMFYNVRNFWEQNTFVKGSLMMRPVFRSPEEVVGIPKEEQPKTEYRIYPNPTSNRLRIEGRHSSWKLIDLQGRNIKQAEYNFAQSSSEISVLGLPKGLYLLQIFEDQNFQTKKIIVE
ncbi:MAG: T9SS type A sorting domain-containing protein [Bernardetiaceae bacterium]|nr:T9SS type A sorting domain-containing protein [Bernardetiaceae bacterium]